jgi:hypothetical protein
MEKRNGSQKCDEMIYFITFLTHFIQIISFYVLGSFYFLHFSFHFFLLHKHSLLLIDLVVISSVLFITFIFPFDLLFIIKSIKSYPILASLSLYVVITFPILFCKVQLRYEVSLHSFKTFSLLALIISLRRLLKGS